MKQRRILVVDDEPGIRQSLGGVLEDEGYAVEAVADAAKPAWRRCRPVNSSWCCWISGSRASTAWRCWRASRRLPFPERPVVVVISGHGSIEAAVKATKLGAFDFLEKPLSIEKVAVVAKNALEHRNLAIENSRLKADSGARYRIIGESVPMKALRQQLTLMAGTNGRVLIFGESGTGKELVAHAHARAEPARGRSRSWR